MRQQSTRLVLAIAAAAATSCSGGGFDVRPIKQPLAAGIQPADFRVAEGHSQLALGNVGLAVEAYRKALRQRPDSVDALLGLATAYEKMGRTDLSRRHYELALAVSPTNPESYALLAQSLDRQGLDEEAARVKAELASRSAAPEAPSEAPGSVSVLPPPPAPSVTVALAPPRSVPVAVDSAGKSMRLARLSMAEVALITSAQPRWTARTVERTAKRTTIRFEARSQTPIRLLNAARVEGLAARTRAYLASRGFGGAQIGDAPAPRQASVIVYSSENRARAERLAAQFGFRLEREEGVGAAVVILLGRDAARDRSLTSSTA
ncbi:LytR C-terminal domain-containing protein [Sphingomonas xanthus]|uniref:Tetratricopeptide repeat protein n=1 Tax=Sphingomonas xanthus TaxID=2594473 RepID=A0A516IRE3_9SPHN|nr:LytR C-terminal domain-containing protein [Sphingomonas xanthus]QDP19465.1 tetratricopeptide repeat protein [Sphingomonas xanthus]